jgi:hypothetical protein
VLLAAVDPTVAVDSVPVADVLPAVIVDVSLEPGVNVEEVGVTPECEVVAVAWPEVDAALAVVVVLAMLTRYE